MRSIQKEVASVFTERKETETEKEETIDTSKKVEREKYIQPKHCCDLTWDVELGRFKHDLEPALGAMDAAKQVTGGKTCSTSCPSGKDGALDGCQLWRCPLLSTNGVTITSANLLICYFMTVVSVTSVTVCVVHVFPELILTVKEISVWCNIYSGIVPHIFNW